MSQQIVRAHVRDIAKVKPLWKQMVSEYATISGGKWRVLEPHEAWQLRFQEYLAWINDASGLVFIAIDQTPDENGNVEDKAVGYAAIRFVSPDSTFDMGETRGELESLVVLPDYRGRGIASDLLAACRKELMRREISYWTTSTLTDNAATIHLFQKNGFKPFLLRMGQRLEDD
ncbi:GNAT family N-acetyltransferase [Dermatophilus congolensis]|uniref:Putative acetyltransferase n=1 Tax=Dermatophilus congolensis TaxID=1863 RepID=A0A239VHI3_9MICO|nr:GNAT family N-acetyltransferase [Dermatophilus congolensis]MBO3128905.1 GNAT family N-acetyltransferase [Dermatophilus congolensis]MBO3132457.1 GNAT family N-acetyltransferase [Dermatophilus congolensis]MBO3133382.1 GNAT family N-acetyltransferase [Dermatophilus congolensis]MBO3135617.1 GNAT family N-acetyltransferase [Dermatophilus congolensis]MBO3137856.1 GNAT family N-acetyltransferase [Dermatophilus congolensis]